MEAFGLVPGIAKQGSEPLLLQGRDECLFVLGMVELRAAIDDCTQDQMIGWVADG